MPDFMCCQNLRWRKIWTAMKNYLSKPVWVKSRRSMKIFLMTEPVPFRQINGGFLVGTQLCVHSCGLMYLWTLIQQPGELIDVKDLYWQTEAYGCERGRGEKERCRQRVRHSIMYAINKLIDDEQTKHIGEHLKESVITGYKCSYSGDWLLKCENVHHNSVSW